MRDEHLIALEVVARARYPGLFLHFDCPLESLGLPGLNADIVAAESPSLSPERVVAVGLVSFGGVRPGKIPTSWTEILKNSKDKPWRIDVYVPKGNTTTARQTLGKEWPWARVVPLPPDRVFEDGY